MNRGEARVIIMTILYQVFMYQNGKINYDVSEVIKDNLEVDNEFVKEMVHGVLDNKEELTSVVNKHLTDWKLNRLGLTDQAIILMGTYELLHTNTPSVVAINEAVELAKKYSDDKVKNVINGVLDKVYHEKD
ncbi:MAG: transcription antitermination factor NusB [Bacilli bacterium]|nr:transcription antitermination factor NusB [Bacilli bacterium]